MPKFIYITIFVLISFGPKCSIVSADDYVIARIYGSIRGYDVELRINDVLVKDTGINEGFALHLFDKNHPLSEKLSQKSPGLFCLIKGENDIEIEFTKVESQKENYIKIEIRSDPELKTIFEYNSDGEYEGKIKKSFYLK